jgi:NADPH2:quinone reductase
MQAIVIEQFGGPEVLHCREVAQPQPSRGQVLIKLAASGLNYIDTYQRTGLYKVPLPFVPGLEASGTVVEVGSGVSEFKNGDRVAYAGVAGAYAEYAAVEAERLIPVPDGISSENAAAFPLQGMTAHYLARSTYPLKNGDTCLVHAGAGGVGLLLIQIARICGAQVIATVSTEEKAELAKAAGAQHVVLYTRTDFETAVKQITANKGVQVVYDSVGKDTFDKSLNCLAPKGYLVLFGQSSGPVPPLDLLTLSAKGSLFVTRPTLGHYVADRRSLLGRAEEVLGWIKEGTLKLRIGAKFALKDAAQAHRALEGRMTTGKVLLVP